MYRKADQPKLTPENFELPKQTKLLADNRWVIMVELIPWSENDRRICRKFFGNNGWPAKPFRMALGALIIQEKLGVTDPRQ